jgi:hypothetical protein
MQISQSAQFIAAPPPTVWERLIDAPGWKSWNPGLAWVALDDRLVPGRYVTVKPATSRQTALRIVTIDAPHCFACEVSVGPLARLRFSWRLVSDGAGTMVRHEVDLTGPLPGLLRKSAQRVAAQIPAHLARLAATCTGATP